MTGGDERTTKREDVYEESEHILDRAPLPKININMRLATQILSSEASKGSSAKNVVCSPLSLEFALHMVGAGSKGNTLSQILKFIGSEEYPLHSMEDLNLKSSGIMRVASPFRKSECKEDPDIESSGINRVASPFYESEDEEDLDSESSEINSVASPFYESDDEEDINSESPGINRVASPFYESDDEDDINSESPGINRVASPFYESDDEDNINSESRGIYSIASPFYESDYEEDLDSASPGIMRGDSPSYQYREVRKKEKEPELSFANGVWVDQRYKLKPSYKELMSRIYEARAESANFGNQADQITKDINSWVAEKTRGLIKGVLGKLDKHVMIILVNALYFKGVWSSPFDETRTKDYDFHLLNGNKVSAPFMSEYDERYFFRAFDGFRVLELHYQSENDNRRQFSMQILLPDETDGLNDLLKKGISDPKFLNQDFGLKMKRIDTLRIPKFKFSYSTEDVQTMMKGLGLTLPFSPTCKDLTEMVELGPGHSLQVSEIHHKATIVVDESGTKAAAATALKSCRYYSCAISSKERLFIADHPFIFIIKEKITGAVFFVGAVLNPLQGD